MDWRTELAQLVNAIAGGFMALSGSDLDDAIAEIALATAGSTGTKSLYLRYPRPCVFVPDAAQATTATRTVVDEEARTLRIFVPVQEGLAPVIAAKALVRDPLAVERGFRVEWNLVIALAGKDDLAVFWFPQDFLAGLANGPDKILFWRRSKEFHETVERVRQDPLHFFNSLFIHAKEALIDNARQKAGWQAVVRWLSVLSKAAGIAAVHYPNFSVPYGFFRAVLRAEKANRDWRYRKLIHCVKFPDFSRQFRLANTTHDLSAIRYEHSDVYQKELKRRERHAREWFGDGAKKAGKVRKSSVPLTPQDVRARLRDKRNKFPATLWRDIDSLAPQDRQTFLDQCLTEVAKTGDRDAALPLIDRGAMLVVGSDGYDPLEFMPKVNLLKRHRDYPNFSPQQLLAIFDRDESSLSALRQAGADLNKANEAGQTLAHLVAQKRPFDFPQLLGVPGLDLQKADASGARPFHYLLKDEWRCEHVLPKLVMANIVDFSDPQLLQEVRKVKDQRLRTHLLLDVAKSTGRLPPWGIYELEEEVIRNTHLSSLQKSEIEQVLLELRTAAVNQDQPQGVCAKCGRPAHRGFCRL